MTRIAAACRGITAVVGWPQAAGAVVYNAASVLRDGLVEQTYRKRELPNSPCSTNAVTSMSIRTAAAACSRSMALRSGC